MWFLLTATVEVRCEGANKNLLVQWIKYEGDTRQRNSFTTTTIVKVKSLKESFLEVKKTPLLHVFNTSQTSYICLEMNQQQCVTTHFIDVTKAIMFIYHTVGETAVLQCPFSHGQPPVWEKVDLYFGSKKAGQNYSHVFPSRC